MSYFEELDVWITAIMLDTDDDEDENDWFERVKKQIKEKILESYRNGQKAGLKPSSPSKQSDTDTKSEDRATPKNKFWSARRSSRK